VNFCFKMRRILSYLTNFKAKKHKNEQKSKPQISFQMVFRGVLKILSNFILQIYVSNFGKKAIAFLFRLRSSDFFATLKNRLSGGWNGGVTPATPFLKTECRKRNFKKFTFSLRASLKTSLA